MRRLLTLFVMVRSARQWVAPLPGRLRRTKKIDTFAVILKGGLHTWRRLGFAMRIVAALSLLVLACGPAQDPTRRQISRSEFGDTWPFTVESGELACVGPGKNVVLTTGGTTYGVNGTAKSRYPTVDPIWKEQPLEEELGTAKSLHRLPEEQRRTVFVGIVGCEDDAQEDRCKEALRRRETLTEDELQQINTEGSMKGWPPLTPTRVNIGPIIQAGLALCAS